MAFLACSVIAMVAAMVVAIGAASISDAADIPTGLDPVALAAMSDAEMRSLDKSRIQGLLRIHPYNVDTLERLALRIRQSLFILVSGVSVALLGFAYIIGGSIP